MDSIILMGIKHCGKSTQGKILSKKLDVKFYDTDSVVEQMTGKTAREIYAQNGKDAFLDAELKACEFIASDAGNNKCVIATGGGICNNTKALEVLRKIGKFVFLNAQEKTACDRIVREVKIEKDGSLSNLPAYISKNNPHSLDEVRAIFHEFYVNRVKIYTQIADICVEMENAPKDVNALQICNALKI